MTGIFALGSRVDLAQELIGRSVDPGEFMLSFSAPAFVVDVPELVPALIFAPAVLALVALRRRTAHRVENVI